MPGTPGPADHRVPGRAGQRRGGPGGYQGNALGSTVRFSSFLFSSFFKGSTRKACVSFSLPLNIEQQKCGGRGGGGLHKKSGPDLRSFFEETLKTGDCLFFYSAKG